MKKKNEDSDEDDEERQRKKDKEKIARTLLQARQCKVRIISKYFHLISRGYSFRLISILD